MAKRLESPSSTPRSMRTPACSMRKRTGASGRSICVDALDAGLFDFGLQRRNQRANCRSARGERGRRRLRVARGHVGQRLRGVRGIERVGEQHRVVHCSAQVSTPCAVSRWSAVFQSCVCLGTAASSSSARSSRSQRQAQSRGGLGADAHVEAGLLLGGFGHIEQRHDCCGSSSASCGAGACIEREGKAFCARGSVEGGSLLFGWLFDQFDHRRCFRRRQARAASR